MVNLRANIISHNIMAQVQGSLLEILKKKMRAMKDDLEATKDQAEENMHKLQLEIKRREEVSTV